MRKRTEPSNMLIWSVWLCTMIFLYLCSETRDVICPGAVEWHPRHGTCWEASVAVTYIEMKHFLYMWHISTFRSKMVRMATELKEKNAELEVLYKKLMAAQKSSCVVGAPSRPVTMIDHTNQWQHTLKIVFSVHHVCLWHHLALSVQPWPVMRRKIWPSFWWNAPKLMWPATTCFHGQGPYSSNGVLNIQCFPSHNILKSWPCRTIKVKKTKMTEATHEATEPKPKKIKKKNRKAEKTVDRSKKGGSKKKKKAEESVDTPKKRRKTKK